MNDIIVSVKNVSKKFCKKLRRSMAYGIADLSKNLVGVKPDSTKLRKDEFWAIDNISFELRRGETLGLIGMNGSGKTTLLRLLAGIFPPDKGEIIVNGRVSALIAVGAGFHPYMTGRENIYLNGAILGMSREEINSRFQDIVDFSKIGDFLDAPVSTYSSGMRVRLGFSIATAIQPDVLLLDEILAVGDIAFQNKCFNKMNALVSEKGIAGILVSHNLQRIIQYTNRTLWLDNGKMPFDGKTEEACRRYILCSQRNQKTGPGSFIETPTSGFHISPSDNLKNISFKMLDNQGNEKTMVKIDEEMCLHFSFYFEGKTDNLEIGIALYRADGLQLMAWGTLSDYVKLSAGNKKVEGSVKIARVNLVPGRYVVTMSIKIGQEYLFRGNPIDFCVISERIHFGFIDLPHEWNVKGSI